jgi:hypothetical protein
LIIAGDVGNAVGSGTASSSQDGRGLDLARGTVPTGSPLSTNCHPSALHAKRRSRERAISAFGRPNFVRGHKDQYIPGYLAQRMVDTIMT